MRYVHLLGKNFGARAVDGAHALAWEDADVEPHPSLDALLRAQKQHALLRDHLLETDEHTQEEQ